jgi:cytochrome c556
MNAKISFRRSASWLALAATAPLLLGTSPTATDREQSKDPTSEVMRQKLGHSQQVLRGLALQDFGLIKTNAAKLVRLSQAGGWAVRQSPDYELFTMEFRRSAEALTAAADAGNIDAATVAYTQLTFSCVSCHKYMRTGRSGKGG